MAGFNLRGGVPANYVLGRGKLYISGDSTRTTDYAAGTPNSQKVWRDVGNVTNFTITQESETKEHRSSLQGLQVVDLEVPVSQKMSIGFTGDEINAVNLARFLSGQYIGFDNDTGATALGNAAAIASNNVAGIVATGAENWHITTLATDRVHDVWYDLELLFDDGFSYRAIDFEAQATQAITVRKGNSSRTATDGTTLVEGDDYEIDRKMGRIRFFVTGANAIAPGDTITVSWAAPVAPKGATAGLDNSLFTIKPLTSSGVTVGVKFVLENANDGDIPMEIEFWQVKLKPDGEFAGIGDDWAALSFTGVVESVDTPGVHGSPYGRIIGRDSFST